MFSLVKFERERGGGVAFRKKILSVETRIPEDSRVVSRVLEKSETIQSLPFSESSQDAIFRTTLLRPIEDYDKPARLHDQDRPNPTNHGRTDQERREDQGEPQELHPTDSVQTSNQTIRFSTIV